MIVDRLERLDRYDKMAPWMPEIRRFLRHADWEEGHYEIGEGIEGRIVEGPLRETGLFEAHRNHVDFQLILRGSETMECTCLDGLTEVGPYDAPQDIFFLDGCQAGARLNLSEGWFAVFFPHDAHKPSLKWRDETCRKLVIKVDVGFEGVQEIR